MVTKVNTVQFGDHGMYHTQFIIVSRCRNNFSPSTMHFKYIEELDDLVLEDADVIDVVELPPEKIDSVTDEEEFADEEELGFGDSKVVSIPGFVEVSCNSVDLVPTMSEEPSTSPAAVNSEVADYTDQQKRAFL